MERAGIVLVLLVVFLLPPLLREFGIAFDPFRDALDTVVPWAFRVLLSLGHAIGGTDMVQHCSGPGTTSPSYPCGREAVNGARD